MMAGEVESSVGRFFFFIGMASIETYTAVIVGNEAFADDTHARTHAAAAAAAQVERPG